MDAPADSLIQPASDRRPAALAAVVGVLAAGGLILICESAAGSLTRMVAIVAGVFRTHSHAGQTAHRAKPAVRAAHQTTTHARRVVRVHHASKTVVHVHHLVVSASQQLGHAADGVTGSAGNLAGGDLLFAVGAGIALLFAVTVLWSLLANADDGGPGAGTGAVGVIVIPVGLAFFALLVVGLRMSLGVPIEHEATQMVGQVFSSATGG